MTSPIRILLIDDQTTIRQALQMLLEQEPGFEIVGGASDGNTGIAAVERLRPDLVLVDIEMPGIDGIETTQIIRERFPETQILVLTGQDDQECLQRALQAGAKGYLLKTTPAEDLVYAIRAVQKGYSQVSPGLIERMMTQTLAPPISPAPAPHEDGPLQGSSGAPDLELSSLENLRLSCRILQNKAAPLLSQAQALKDRLRALAFDRDGFEAGLPR